MYHAKFKKIHPRADLGFPLLDLASICIILSRQRKQRRSHMVKTGFLMTWLHCQTETVQWNHRTPQTIPNVFLQEKGEGQKKIA